MIARALTMAKKYHKYQFYGDKPYMSHIIDVLLIASEYTEDNQLLASCILHDIVEDTPMTIECIDDKFSYSVAKNVDAVTCKKGWEDKQIMSSAFSTRDSAFVKLCDRIANLEAMVNVESAVKRNALIKKYKNQHEIMSMEGYFTRYQDDGVINKLVFRYLKIMERYGK